MKGRILTLFLPFLSPLSPQAAAAVKIGMLMKFPTKATIIFQIDVKQLFDQAQTENVPFHEVCACVGILFLLFWERRRERGSGESGERREGARGEKIRVVSERRRARV